MKKISALVFLAILAIGGYSYIKIFKSNVRINQTVSLYFPAKQSLEVLEDSLKPYLKDMKSFDLLAGQKKLIHPRGGYYTIKPGMSNNALVNMFRAGLQKPVKVTFNNQATLKALAKRIATQLESDETALYNTFTDASFLAENGFNKHTAISMYLPNSYAMYWTVSPEKFRAKMLRNYRKFWNKKRLDKARKLNLSPEQVITLAAIVNAETVKADERPRVAGVYLNRLKKGWPLEADPTIKYALIQKIGKDTIIRRVLNKDKLIDSPYNTYKNVGLPPGPINMPDISSIDAVLNAENHSYMFFVASVKRLGYHEFSKTLAQHNRYAQKYHDYINKLGIRR